MKSRAKFVTSLFSLIAISVSGAAVANQEKFGQQSGQFNQNARSQTSSGDFDDFAKVINVIAQVEQINRPRQECRTEIVQVNRQVQTQGTQPRANGGAIIGGIAGALIGNQIGSGSGRTTATAAGAIIGALSGDRLENNAVQQANVETISSEQPVQRCRMVDNFESRTTGFNVTYEYKGRQYSSVLPFDPGNRLKVNVTVTPVQ
jgi:uncharacterized protein YcfJ